MPLLFVLPSEGSPGTGGAESPGGECLRMEFCWSPFTSFPLNSDTNRLVYLVKKKNATLASFTENGL
jgi:hypothetical protein